MNTKVTVGHKGETEAQSSCWLSIGMWASWARTQTQPQNAAAFSEPPTRWHSWNIPAQGLRAHFSTWILLFPF